MKLKLLLLALSMSLITGCNMYGGHKGCCDRQAVCCYCPACCDFGVVTPTLKEAYVNEQSSTS